MRDSVSKNKVVLWPCFFDLYTEVGHGFGPGFSLQYDHIKRRRRRERKEEGGRVQDRNQRAAVSGKEGAGLMEPSKAFPWGAGCLCHGGTAEGRSSTTDPINHPKLGSSSQKIFNVLNSSISESKLGMSARLCPSGVSKGKCPHFSPL